MNPRIMKGLGGAAVVLIAAATVAGRLYLRQQDEYTGTVIKKERVLRMSPNKAKRMVDRPRNLRPSDYNHYIEIRTADGEVVRKRITRPDWDRVKEGDTVTKPKGTRRIEIKEN